MAFSYYARLRPRQQAIYRQSDAVVSVALARPEELRPAVLAIEAALARDDRRGVEGEAAALAEGLTRMLGVRPVSVRVLAVRPTLRSSELHGLYTPDARPVPRIQVWMRTARHRRVVAFRTFLRTLLHELVHHLDYTYLKLADSYHTEGFFRRESSLFHQIVG